MGYYRPDEYREWKKGLIELEREIDDFLDQLPLVIKDTTIPEFQQTIRYWRVRLEDPIEVLKTVEKKEEWMECIDRIEGKIDQAEKMYQEKQN